MLASDQTIRRKETGLAHVESLDRHYL